MRQFNQTGERLRRASPHTRVRSAKCEVRSAKCEVRSAKYEVRRLIAADTITEIHQRSRGTYGRRRVRSALLADYEMNVDHKLVNSIMAETRPVRTDAPRASKAPT